MRIIHILQPQGRRSEASLTHIPDLARAGTTTGHSVGMIWLQDGNNPDARRAFGRIEKFCSGDSLYLPFDTRNIYTNLTSTIPVLKKAVDFVQEQLRQDTSEPLVLHGHGEAGVNLACHVRKKTDPRKRRTICVCSPGEAFLNAPRQRLLPLTGSSGSQWSRADGLIFNSKLLADHWQQKFGPLPCPARVIHDGLAEQEFAPRQIIDMASDFLFVGRLDRECGLDTLIRALARMKNTHTTGALVAGTGPAEKQFRAQVDRYGLSHRVFFNAPLDARLAFLKGGCLVLPARPKTIPVVALRAAAVGMPMILTGETGLPELTGDIKMPRVAAGNTEALQQQLTAYLTSPQAFLARATALRQRVAEEFTLARMQEQTEAFYRELLN